MIVSGTKRRTRSPIGNNYQQAKLFRGIRDNSEMLMLKPGYKSFPSTAQIFQNKFVTENLEISYGQTVIKWAGVVDLSQLKAPLWSVIDMGRDYVEVYPDENEKPVEGKQLNRTCLVTFRGFKKMTKSKMHKICHTNGCQLVRFDIKSQQSVVEIPHFTKYRFQEDIEEDQKDMTGSFPHQRGLVEELRDRHAADLLNQRKKQALIQKGENIQGRSYDPPVNLINKIEKNNVSNGHKTQEQRIYGSCLAYGQGRAILNETHPGAGHAHTLSLSSPSSPNFERFEEVFSLIQNEENVIDYVLNRKNPFHLRRVLALYIICFKFSDCFFEFEKDEAKALQLIRVTKKPKQYLKNAYLKNWLEWVINTDAQNLYLPADQSLRALCLRRNEEQAQKCLQYDRFEEAEFLCCIEDQFYRLGNFPKYLSVELKSITMRDMASFSTYHWVVKLAIYLWYMNFTEEENSIIPSLLNDSRTGTDYSLERHLLKMVFCEGCNSQNIEMSQDSNMLIWWWMISYKLNQREKQFFKKRNNVYSRYRHNLLSELVSQCPETQMAIKFISHDKYVPNQQKVAIAKQFANNDLQTLDELRRSSILEEKDVREIQGLLEYNRQNYIKALQILAEALPGSLSTPTYSLICAIIQKEQVLCTFHHSTSLKLLGLLQKINQPALKPYILFLKVHLQEVWLEWSTFQQLKNLSFVIKNRTTSRWILNCVFKRMLGNPNFMSLLARDIQKYSEVQELFGEDQKKRMELKMAKISM